MFILLQLAIGVITVIQMCQNAVFQISESFDDPIHILHGKCIISDNEKDSWWRKDSYVTQMLNCVLLSLPLQQFISCYYTIPMQHGFFDSGTIVYETVQEEGQFPPKNAKLKAGLETLED